MVDLDLDPSSGPSPFLPVVRGSLGAGWLWGAERPYAVATIGLRIGRRLRFLVDWGVRYGAVPYAAFEAEIRAGELVRHDRWPSRVWGVGRELRLGLDARVP